MEVQWAGISLPNREATRTVYPEVPARVEYELTDLGHSAAAPLKHLRDWVEHNVGTDQ